MASVRSLLVMLLGPPLLLLFWAHFIRDTWPGLDWPTMIVAGLVGLIGIVTPPWGAKVEGGVGVAYLAIVIAALPFVGLLAVCSTGDRL